MIKVRDIRNIILELSGMPQLSNDSYIECSNYDMEVSHILAGIDIGVPEINVAYNIGADCIIGHHPALDAPILSMHKDYYYQKHKMEGLGILTSEIEESIKKNILNDERKYHKYNYNRVSSVAKLYGIPYINIHTTADIITENIIYNFINNELAKSKFNHIGELLEILNKIPEIRNSPAKPYLLRMNKENDIGNLLILMTCSPSTEIFNMYFQNGIDTIVCMYEPDVIDEFLKVLPDNKNIIVAGHMSCDSIGINAILNEIQKYGTSITSISGLFR